MLAKNDYTRVFLWRHPEVSGFTDGKVYGHMDVALTAKGKTQEKAVVKRMTAEKLAAVYSSDLQRTRRVAEAVAREQNPRLKVEALPELRELNLGLWEGMSYSEIKSKYPKELKARFDDLAGFRISGGESLEDLANRVVPAFQDMVAKNRGRSFCIIAHAGVNRVLLCKILGAPLDRVFRIDQDFACLNLIDVFADGIPLVRRINEIVE